MLSNQNQRITHVSLIHMGVIWNYNVSEEQFICNPAYQLTRAGLTQLDVIDLWNKDLGKVCSHHSAYSS